jgi:hypothetical protein
MVYMGLMLSHPICPPTYVPSETENRLAYHRYHLESLVGDRLQSIWMGRTGQLDSIDPSVDWAEKVDQELTDLLAQMFEPDRPDSMEAWEFLERHWCASYEDWRAQVLGWLGEPHCGDCTAVAAGCMRCRAEELYGVPNTATWGGRHEGNRLMHEYRALQTPKVVP